MTVNINFEGKEREVADQEKSGLNIDTKKILEKVVDLGVFTFVAGEVNRIRPPRRNAGLILNFAIAGVVTDAIMNLAKRGKKTSEDEVVECNAKSCDCEFEADECEKTRKKDKFERDEDDLK